ncbi:MAG: GNAT family N-acetyltransferase [Flavobacteriaceae bacterium]|jgi:ribosomal protein S18 acetylase RimI-like enzyme|nr:GNAT family N-acetyltransferase [Flavobacteriaceae bacterium]
MNLKIAEEKDFSVIQEIAHKTWTPTFGSILSKKQIDYMLEMMYSTESLKNQTENQGHIYILIGEEEKYFGYVSYELNYQNSGKTKIHKIYILPDYQGKSLGKRLINEVSKIAENDGDNALILNVNRENNAFHFYEKTGFKVVKEENIDIGNGFFMNDFVMEKEIKFM